MNAIQKELYYNGKTISDFAANTFLKMKDAKQKVRGDKPCDLSEAIELSELTGISLTKISEHITIKFTLGTDNLFDT